MPRDIWRKCAEAGWLAGVIGAPWPTKYAGTKIAGGVLPEEYGMSSSLAYHRSYRIVSYH